MTLKKNFNFMPNSADGFKNRQNPQIYNQNYNYLDSYMKSDKYGNYDAINQDQRLSNMPNYDTQFKDKDFSASKINGKLNNLLWNSQFDFILKIKFIKYRTKKQI